ncbi:hypothetical protein [Piscibacillus salipiscarius]|uniref:5,10-methylene-tetrahydrofolate dehydrogenase n=1 Tax=Piscibacillus salipiscarius TaxID=299480 RepID=A0ABW5Q746_9BACI|nr:hypothetical protein [Piscibacillus salipiscarius]
MSSSYRRVKLITAPGFANEVICELEDELPSLLKQYVNDQWEWEVEQEEDALTGSTGDTREILETILSNIKESDVDYLICLTDLPLFHDGRVVVSEAYEEENVAIISIPGLGSTPMRKRIKSSIIQLVNEMYYESSEEGYERLRDKIKEAGKDGLRVIDGRILVGRKGFEKFSPIKREVPKDGEHNIDVRFTVPSKIWGGVRILTGMVRANQPWRMFPAFVKVLVVAFATGAYALVFPTLWTLTSDYEIWRLAMLSVVSIFAMVTWIMLAHNLWESPRHDTHNRKRWLYNIATAFTLLISVTLFYINLYLMFLISVFIFIPLPSLESQVGSSSSYVDYFFIAWLISSFATIIGALGTALESEETILSATYGYRQKQRYEQLKKRKEEEKQEEKS